MGNIFNGFKGAAKGIAQSRANRKVAGIDPVEEGHLFCTACGHQGKPESDTPGSIWIEVVLWLCFLIPGLIYSIWRLNKRHDVCTSCGRGDLIPANSPKAMAQKKQMGSVI